MINTSRRQAFQALVRLKTRGRALWRKPKKKGSSTNVWGTSSFN